jgi:hypothetical protein
MANRVGPTPISAASLVAQFAAPVVDELGVAAGRPIVLVEPDTTGALREWSPGLRPVIVVGLRQAGWHGEIESDDPCDVVLAADDSLLPAVVEAVARHPIAACALGVLLRHGPPRTVEEGLAAESAVYSLLQAGPEFTAWRRTRPKRSRPDERRSTVLVERSGARLDVTLNRPERHNALGEVMRAELTEALALATIDETITEIRLRGAGPSFCSGGDLDEFGLFPDPATAHASRLTRNPAVLAHQLRDRLVVELHGACLGAGIEIPAFARRVVGATDTDIALPEIGIGLIPGAGGTVSIAHRIGRHRTLLLALTGIHLDVTTAHQWGLVDTVA